MIPLKLLFVKQITTKRHIFTTAICRKKLEISQLFLNKLPIFSLKSGELGGGAAEWIVDNYKLQVTNDKLDDLRSRRNKTLPLGGGGPNEVRSGEERRAEPTIEM
jgi:hypothetical protein